MSQPGLARQTPYRTLLRLLAVVLGLVAVGCFLRFGLLVSRDFVALEQGGSDSGLSPMWWFVGGGVAMVAAAMVANRDFLAPAGRSAAGRWCAQCGKGNDDDARFCDGCGRSFA